VHLRRYIYSIPINYNTIFPILQGLLYDFTRFKRKKCPQNRLRAFFYEISQENQSISSALIMRG
jgi:hypothetical protein